MIDNFVENMRVLQQIIYENRCAKCGDIQSVAGEFNLIHGEISDAYTAQSRGNNISSELADIVIHVLSLAEYEHINLGEAIINRIAMNNQDTTLKSEPVSQKVEKSELTELEMETITQAILAAVE